MSTLRVLYAGDVAIAIWQELVGAELLAITDRWMDNGRFLRGALAKDKDIRVTHMPSFVAYQDFPQTAHEMAKYDALILSDVGYDTLALYPGEQRERVPMGPNRVIEITKFVKNGGGLIFCGGWYSFQGRFGYGRWYGTHLAEILPVAIQAVPDDRREAPEGVVPKILNAAHPVTKGIDWASCPPFVGYNKLGVVKMGGSMLATIGPERDPFIVVGKYGKGNILVFSADPAPHWGSAFKDWKEYPRFWIQSVRWVAQKEKGPRR